MSAGEGHSIRLTLGTTAAPGAGWQARGGSCWHVRGLPQHATLFVHARQLPVQRRPSVAVVQLADDLLGVGAPEVLLLAAPDLASPKIHDLSRMF